MSAPGASRFEPAGQAEAQPLGDQMLQQALQEEALRASRGGQAIDPMAGINFKEVSSIVTALKSLYSILLVLHF